MKPLNGGSIKIMYEADQLVIMNVLFQFLGELYLIEMRHFCSTRADVCNSNNKRTNQQMATRIGGRLKHSYHLLLI